MRIVTDTSNPAAAAGQELSVHLEIYRGTPVLLLLSGGSAFSLLPYVSSDLLGPHVTIAMLDERYSENPQVSNFAQLMATEFYSRAVVAGVAFFDSQVLAGETAPVLADRFETFLRTWHEANLGGVVVATLGMGADGHTAGIFPGQEEVLGVRGRWVETSLLSEGVNPYRERVTVTPEFLTTKVTVAVVYVAGKEKQPQLSKLVTEDVSPKTYPVALWKQMQKVIVVTDQYL